MIKWLEINGKALSTIMIIFYLITLLAYFICLLVLAIRKIDYAPKNKKNRTFLPFVLSILYLIIIVAVAGSIPNYISVIILTVSTLLQMIIYLFLGIKKCRRKTNEK